MKLKRSIYLLLTLILFLCCRQHADAQQHQPGQQGGGNNAKIAADKAKRDSIANALTVKRKADSTARELAKQKLQAFRDSIYTARNAKRKADSLAREQAKLSIAQKRRMTDSLAKARIKKQDSIKLARANHADSLRIARENKAKQLKALEKYKNSRRYKDSLAALQKHKTDSLAYARQLKKDFQQARAQQTRDSMLTVRNHYNDSLKAVRKKISDSTKAANLAMLDKIKADRQRFKDSMATIRARRDSLLALKKPKDGSEKESAKKKEEKKNALAIKMIHDKKQEEWSNEKLLKRKWTLTRRIYQNTVTRYNYFYNARRKYYDAINTLKKNNKDDYSKLLNIYPFDIQKAGTSVAGEMDSVIKKASFSTQIHDPRSKWFDNLYYLMGRASFVKNDFDGSITTFQFIANEYKNVPKKKKKPVTAKYKPAEKQSEQAPDLMSISTIEKHKGLHKLNHQPIRNDALLWLARSYTEAEQYGEAAALLGTLQRDKLFPKRLKADLFLHRSNLEIRQKNYPEAIASLEEALKYKMPSLQKARAEFVIGQLYAMGGDYAQSSAHLKKSISGKANPEMDFYTKLMIAQNAAKGGGDRQFAIRQLDRLIKDPKFEKYKSEAYLALASIYEDDDADHAIDILNKSLKTMDSKNPLDKAKTFELLGRLYYKKGSYELAKASYDSAAQFGTNPPLDNINEVNTRKEVLTDVVKNIKEIRRQDSLLALAQKSEKEQKAIAKKEAERLKKLEEEKAAANTTTVVALTPGNMTVQSNWYFYNTSMAEKGAAEFKQKWGNRKLEDNWRRRAASSNMIAEGTEGNEKEGEEKKLLINGSQYETLLAEIPKTPAQKDKANDLIMNAYYNLGVIYYGQLQDYPKSVESFDSLLKRYPNTTLKKQSYYSLYIDHSLLKHEAEGLRYKKLLQDEFGNSELAQLANNPDYLQQQKDNEARIDQYYDSTYLAYQDARYADAQQRIGYAREHYTGKAIMAKFELVDAICFAGMKDYDKCKAGLEKVIRSYPATKEQERAQEILNYLKTKDTVSGDSATVKMAADTLNKNVAPEIKNAEGKGVYTYEPNSEHQFIVFVNKVDGRLMALKSGLSDFNLFKHETEGLSTGQNLFTVKQGVISVAKFSNAVFAKIYMNDVLKETALFKGYAKEEFDVSLISTSNFMELLKTRDVLGYLDFYRKNYK